MKDKRLIDFFRDKPKILLPSELRNVFSVYETSFAVENLVSEEDRTIFAEAVKEEEDEKFVETLQYLAVKKLADLYKRGPIDERIQLDNLELFGSFCDVESPLEDLLELEVN